MRGDEQKQGAMFSPVTMEQQIPASHPIRPIRGLVDEALRQMEATFSALYSKRGPAVDRCGTAAVCAMLMARGLRAEKVTPHVAEYAPNPRWANW